MDRTAILSRICPRILLFALSIQSLTPDALDLTLLNHRCPPGHLLAILSLIMEDRQWNYGDTSSSGSSLGLVEPGGQADQSDEFPGDISQPLWPEVGLDRNPQSLQKTSLKEISTWSQPVHCDPEGRRVDRRSLPHLAALDRSCSLCRYNC
jgi:hypothetical protein